MNKTLAKDWQNRLQSVGLAVREDRSSVGIVQVDPDPWGKVVDSLVNVPANVNGVDNLFSKCTELRDFSLSVFSLVNLLSRKLGFHYVWRKHVLVSCREKKRIFQGADRMHPHLPPSLHLAIFSVSHLKVAVFWHSSKLVSHGNVKLYICLARQIFNDLDTLPAQYIITIQYLCKIKPHTVVITQQADHSSRLFKQTDHKLANQPSVRFAFHPQQGL